VPDSLIMRLDKGRLSDPTGALRYPPRRTTQIVGGRG
jgi:cell division transport system ATP-binding protein